MIYFLPTLTFKRIIFIIAILGIMQSCQQKENFDSNCLEIALPDTLRFNVVDKNTGEDLFFSNSPEYTTDQIHFTTPNATFNIKPRAVTSSNLGKHFLMTVGTGNDSGIIKSYISNNLVHTLQYNVKKHENNGCPRYLFDKIIINNEQTEQNVQGRVLQLKK